MFKIGIFNMTRVVIYVSCPLLSAHSTFLYGVMKQQYDQYNRHRHS